MDINSYLKEHLENVVLVGELPSMLSPFTSFKNVTQAFVIENMEPIGEPSSITELPPDDAPITPLTDDAVPMISSVNNDAPMISHMVDVTTSSPTVSASLTSSPTNQPATMGKTITVSHVEHSYIYDQKRDERLKNMMRGLYVACAVVNDLGPTQVVTDLYRSVTRTDSMKYLTNVLNGSMNDILIFTCTSLLANSVNGNIFKVHIKQNKLIINILATLTRDLVDGGDYFEMVVRLRKLNDPNINQALYRGFSQQYAHIEMERAPFTEYKLIAMVMYILDLYNYSTANGKYINFKKIINKIAQGEHRALVAAIAGWLLGGIDATLIPPSEDAELFVNNNFGYYFTGDGAD